MKKLILNITELRNIKGGIKIKPLGFSHYESSSVTNEEGSSGEGETGSSEAEEELP